MELQNSFIAGNDGDTVLFSDVTGTTAPDSYGKGNNIAYSEVDFFRLRIATLSSIDNLSYYVAGDTLPINVELLCTSNGSFTIDSKTISAGEYITPRVDGIVVPSNCTFVSTGNYLYVPTSFNATTSLLYQVPTTLSLAEINQASNTYVQTNTYILNYDIYNAKSSTTAAAVANQVYICMSGTATYDGSVYRAGEIFTATDTSNITTTGEFAKLYASKTTYSTIVYTLLSSIFSILEANQETTISQEIYGIRCELEALQFSCYTGNVSFTYARKLLSLLTGKIASLVSIT
jgi:hypothetical protein